MRIHKTDAILPLVTMLSVALPARLGAMCARERSAQSKVFDVRIHLQKYVVFLLATFAVAAMAPAQAGSFVEGYRITRGDSDGDGSLDDLFVAPGRRIIIIPGEIDVPVVTQPVRDFVLEYGGAGTFTLKTQLSETQRATMRQWPAAQVDAWLRDVDGDGHVDLELTGLSRIISGAHDQFVFAPTATNASPSRLTVQNSTFSHYHDQVFGWMYNNNYFEDNAPLKITSAEPASRTWVGSVRDRQNVFLINEFLQACQFQNPNSLCAVSDRPPPPPCLRTGPLYDENGNYVGDGTTNICEIDIHIIVYQPQQVTTAKDYTVFDADARETTEILERLTETCPVFPATDEARLQQIQERIWQHIFLNSWRSETDNSFQHTAFPGDDLFDTGDATYHHYDVYTKVCDVSEPNCTMPVIRDQALRHFSVPSRRLAAMPTNIPGPPLMAYVSLPGFTDYPNTYLRGIGHITQRYVETGRWTGSRQNITQSDHLVYPGTISRYIDTNVPGARQANATASGGSSLYIFTHGVGINRYDCDLYQESRPLQVLFGYANDVYGQKAFAQLDKQMIRWWRQNYGVSGAQQAQASMQAPAPVLGNPRSGAVLDP